jgi:hypothetical protein
MSALRGNLKDFGIAEVFQLIGQQRKTGVLVIDHDEERVSLLFDGGAVVTAEPVGGAQDGALAEMLLRCGIVTRETLLEVQREMETSLRRLGSLLLERGALEPEALRQIEDLLTQETLFGILRWERGSFAFTASEVDHDRGGRLLGAEQILMDGLRMVDEWRTFADRVPADATVFQRVGRFEEWSVAREAEGQELEAARRVFQLVDGRLSVRRVIDLARLGTFDATRTLVALQDAGLIEPLDPSQLARRPPRVQLEVPRPSARPLLAGALPLLLLLGLAFYALRPPPAANLEGMVPWTPRPMLAARTAFEAERVRKALEAYRFQLGGWPEHLEELVSAGYLETGALTPSEGRPYYYARRGDEAVLLAPEH